MKVFAYSGGPPIPRTFEEDSSIRKGVGRRNELSWPASREGVRQHVRTCSAVAAPSAAPADGVARGTHALLSICDAD